MSAVKRASFAIEDMKEGGGGLFDNVRAVIVGGKFSKEAPDNYQASGNPIFGWAEFELKGLEKNPGESDDEFKVRTHPNQTYSLGAQAGDNFTISDDGDYLIPVHDDAQIVKDSKFGIFCQKLQTGGVAKTIMSGFGWSLLKGLDGQFVRVEDEKITGKAREFNDAGTDKRQKQNTRKPQTLVLVKLYAMPGEKAATTNAAAASTSASTSAPAAPAPEGDLDTVTGQYLLEILAKAKDNKVQRSQLTLLLSKQAIADARRADIAKRGADEGFLKELADAGLVQYDPAAKPQYVTAAA
jgi:hypothetical protein